MTKYSAIGTTHIGIDPATNLFHAARFGRDTGRAPTLAISINWDRLGIPEESASAVFRDLRRRVRRHWKYEANAERGLGGLEDFGVHENPNGKRNTHWAVHVRRKGLP